jgi:hypothetical protein
MVAGGAAAGRILGGAAGSAIEDWVFSEKIPPPKIEGFTDHGWERFQEAGLGLRDLNDPDGWQRQPQHDNTTLFIGRTATVVLNENNWVVSAWRTGTMRLPGQ